VLRDLFDIDREVLAFRDFDELLHQATRLLHETGLTARLGDAAARRAHQDHTYQHRISTILERVCGGAAYDVLRASVVKGASRTGGRWPAGWSPSYRV
jgi:spore maturation protein CgeB